MWDVFISHASEDKEDFVRPMAEKLRERCVKVWYDQFTLRLGDSIRKRIDEGLKNSRYAVVVFGNYFFQKNWPQAEFDGLLAIETADRLRILPVWHGVGVDEVRTYSPLLAGRFAVSTGDGIERVVECILERISWYSVTDHREIVHRIDVSRLESHGSPVAPSWFTATPTQLGSRWLEEKLAARAPLRLYRDRSADGENWIVVDPISETGVALNSEQALEIAPRSISMITTTTTPPPQLDRGWSHEIFECPRPPDEQQP